MIALDRRTFLTSVPAVALIGQVKPAIIQPIFFQNDIWRSPEARKFADLLRDAILRSASTHFVGAARSPDTAKYRLGTCYTEECVNDGYSANELSAIFAQELTEDLQRHKEIFNHGRPFSLVALDGAMVIDPMTFQPMVRFYIEWHG